MDRKVKGRRRFFILIFKGAAPTPFLSYLTTESEKKGEKIVEIWEGGDIG